MYLNSRKLPSLKKLPEQIRYAEPGSRAKPELYDIDEQWFLPRSDISESKMFFAIQRFDTKGYGERIRVGYYIIGKKGRFKGKWAWGQFCPFIVGKDLGALIKKAKNKGML